MVWKEPTWMLGEDQKGLIDWWCRAGIFPNIGNEKESTDWGVAKVVKEDIPGADDNR